MAIAIEASEIIATRFVDAIKRSFERLQQFPLSGPARERLGAGVRVAFHRPYAIYYRPEADAVVIVRVLHGARDISVIDERGDV